MSFGLVSIDALLPYEGNSRTHSDEQVSQIASSIDAFGFVGQIVTRDGKIAKGHGTLQAVKKLLAAGKLIYPPPGKSGGAEPFPRGMIPAQDATGWSDEQFRAYVIADNRIALNAGWDEDVLRLEMQSLSAADFDMDMLGFDEKELAAMLAELPTAGQTDPDDTPDVQTTVITNPGDIWLLGRHRIQCGDSTDAENVAALLQGVKPHLMVTDPPYGVEYDADWRNKAERQDGEKLGGRATGKVLNDDRADWREAWALFQGDVAYVWHAPGENQLIVAESLKASGFELRQHIIWAKSQLVIGRGHYHYMHEPCWYVVRKRQGATGHWNGDRKQTSLWQIAKPQKSETGHSTQKPVECMRRPIENNSSPGQAVYEPFSGSGTTIIACEQTGRVCYAMELNPAYVDVAVRRWQQFTGKQAILEQTGHLFDEASR